MERDRSLVFNSIFKISKARSTFHLVLVSACVAFLFLDFQSSLAQENVRYPDNKSYYIGAGLGPLLPFKVAGVVDTYPAWGLWFSHPSEVSQVEYSIFSVNAKGVTFYNFSVGLRIDYEVAMAVQAYFTLGLDGNYYKRKESEEGEFDFAFKGGSHVGFGVLQKLAVDLFLRGDCKLNLSPGKSLYIGLGLMWEFGGSGENSSR
ncbi:MAG: hypothetical protein IPL83_12570 [Bdellovibrionales bacterium]|nr:hypothetical protein [Bdellovibrionales bacterium]